MTLQVPCHFITMNNDVRRVSPKRYGTDPVILDSIDQRGDIWW